MYQSIWRLMRKLQARELPGWTIPRKFHAANYRRFTVNTRHAVTPSRGYRSCTSDLLYINQVNLLEHHHQYVCSLKQLTKCRLLWRSASREPFLASWKTQLYRITDLCGHTTLRKELKKKWVSDAISTGKCQCLMTLSLHQDIRYHEWYSHFQLATYKISLWWLQMARWLHLSPYISL